MINKPVNSSIVRTLRERPLPLLIACVVLCAATPLFAQEYDVVIRNGRVLDGAGNPWIAADVAIKDGRFVRIGTIDGKGKVEIDASGKYVSPGWIDSMDQSGPVLPKNGLAENKLFMGVTTAIGGEGGTPVPADEIDEYFAGLERSGISINFGTYFSATQARIAVLGMDSRAPNAEELEQMKAIIEKAMRSGAMGMTTALIYPPSSYAKTPELIELAKVAGKYGGIYASHIRDEGKGLVGAVEEAIEIGEKGGLPVEIFHLKAAYQPGWGRLMREAGEAIERARGRGVDVAADIYLYTAGGTGLEAVIPSWAFEGGAGKLIERLNDPQTRARLKREIVEGSPGWWNIVEASGGWENIILVNARNEQNARFEGKSLAQIAKELNKDPADAAFDLVLQGSARVYALYFMMSEDDVITALQFPWTSIGSDAGAALKAGEVDTLGLPHPRSYGNHPRLIARFVLEKKVISLEEAIRKMTSWPATRFRIPSRGLVKEGMWADAVIFDYEKIDDRATFEKPLLSPVGIEYVLVNGTVVVEKGTHTGAKPGKVIYGPGKQD
ncbi:MAG TPA: D-aminoacylase [Aridibacter sp.]|nr:D-aminoacylase [Aridibacter sp.]